MPRPSRIETWGSVVGILAGFAVIVGFVSIHVAVLIPNPAFPAPTDPEQAAYVATIRNLIAVAYITIDVAVGMFIMLAWSIGLSKSEIPDRTRTGVWVFATVTLAFWFLTAFTFLPAIFLAIYF